MAILNGFNRTKIQTLTLRLTSILPVIAYHQKIASQSSERSSIEGSKNTHCLSPTKYTVALGMSTYKYQMMI